MEKANKAFEKLKNTFSSALILVMFNLEKEVIVETNALDYTIRVYISQKDNNRKLRLIVFYSRKMNSIELNYKIHNKELLAIVKALKE